MRKQIQNPVPDYLKKLSGAEVDEIFVRTEARESIRAFIKYMRPCGLMSVAYDPARHHELIIDKIEEMVEGMEDGDPEALNKFMLSCPPGSAKSTYVNVIAPCWLLARNPKIQILTLANSDQLAEQFSRDRRTLMKTKQWMNVAQTELDPDAQSLKFQQCKQGGFIRSASAGAVITGFRCDILLCDDLVPSFEFSQSAGQLDKLWHWFEHEARSRLKPKGIQFIIGTRWSTADPIGMLIQRSSIDLETIEFMRLPMECDDPIRDPLGRKMGERLWPEWFTDQMIQDAKLSPLMWRCLYQQNPADKAGEWCGQEHFHIEQKEPDDLRYVMGIDIALSVGGGDWSVIVIAGIDTERKLHIVDIWREQTTPDRIAAMACKMVKQYNPFFAVIDNDNASKMWATVLGAKCRELKVFVPLDIMKMANRAKEERAAMLRGMLMEDKVIFKRADWTSIAQDEVLNFPSNSPTVHDDIIDALALIARKMPFISPPLPKQTEVIKHALQIGPGGSICTSDTLGDLFELNEKQAHKLGFQRLRI